MYTSYMQSVRSVALGRKLKFSVRRGAAKKVRKAHVGIYIRALGHLSFLLKEGMKSGDNTCDERLCFRPHIVILIAPKIR